MSEAVFTAIQSGTAEELAALLAERPECIFAVAPSGHSTWRFAGDLGRADQLDVLRRFDPPSDPFDFIALGDLQALARTLGDADVNHAAPSFDGWTLLHLAAFYGHAELVGWLLNRGARIDAISENPLANQPLHAVLAGSQARDVVELLIQAGVDPGFAAGQDVTPLHLAASRGNMALIDRLLELGVDARAAMANGQSAADMARERGFPEAAERIERYKKSC